MAMTILENTIKSDVSKTNLIIINRLDSYISERLVDLINISNDNYLQKTLAGSNAEFSKIKDVEKYIDLKNQEWESVPSNTTSPLIQSTINNPDADALRVLMFTDKKIFNATVYDNIFATNTHGVVVASSGKLAKYYHGDDADWQETKKNGLYIDNIGYDKDVQHLDVGVSKTIYDPSGNFLGIVKGVINYNNIVEKTAKSIPSVEIPIKYYELVRSDGLVGYSTDKNHIAFEFTYAPQFMDNMKANSGNFIESTSNQDISQLVTYSHTTLSKTFPSANWVFIIKYDANVILKPVHDQFYMMGTILILITIASVLIAIYNIRKIVKGISIFLKLTSDIAAGTYKKIDIRSFDELESLAKNFNIMTDKTLENIAKWKKLFEVSPDSTVLADKNGNIIDCNERFCVLFGYSREEVVGKSVSMLESGQNIEETRQHIDDLRVRGHVYNRELWAKKKDGTSIRVLLSIDSMKDIKGNILHIGIIKDISEIYTMREKLEDESERKYEYIKELKVKNEQLQHTTEQLQHTTNELEKLDSAKDEFMAIISHELMTPLFPIKFNTEMLKDPNILGNITNEQLRSVNEIYENTTKLEKLVNDIVDVYKLEIGNMPFKKIEFDVGDVMTKIYESNMPFMKDRQIQFVNNTEEKITLTSDPDKIYQVFSNLIENSISFITEKNGRIDIGAKSQEMDVLFYVKDNGVGISKYNTTNIFKKFYQIDMSITRKHSGIGIGLAICKGIVEGLGGKIWVESKEGLGTMMQFTIPKGNNK